MPAEPTAPGEGVPRLAVSIPRDLMFTSHWGAEFSVGAGYAYLLYDKFYNIHNGAQFGTGEKHYFGLTKLGASVYYRF